MPCHDKVKELLIQARLTALSTNLDTATNRRRSWRTRSRLCHSGLHTGIDSFEGLGQMLDGHDKGLSSEAKHTDPPSRVIMLYTFTANFFWTYPERSSHIELQRSIHRRKTSPSKIRMGPHRRDFHKVSFGALAKCWISTTAGAVEE